VRERGHSNLRLEVGLLMSATIQNTIALRAILADLQRAINEDRLEDALQSFERALEVYHDRAPSLPEPGYEVDAAGTFTG
jgi:hypothetical protein